MVGSQEEERRVLRSWARTLAEAFVRLEAMERHVAP